MITVAQWGEWGDGARKKIRTLTPSKHGMCVFDAFKFSTHLEIGFFLLFFFFSPIF